MPRTAVLAVFLFIAALPASAAAAERVTVADPAGGARWSATQSTGPDGRICATIRRGRTSKGRSCAILNGRLAFAYNVRTEGARRPRDTRTVLIAAFTPDVVRATLRTPDGTRTYRRRSGRPRLLLAVLSGRVERPPLRVEVQRGGRTTVLTEGTEPSLTVPDPQGGPAWRTVSVAGSGGGVCAAWERVQPRYGARPSPQRGTPRCGDPDDDLPVAAAQLVAGRLVVFGVAGEAVASVVLRGLPAGERRIALEDQTRSLLAVVPGGTDPRTLRVAARLADGREVERPLTVVK